jgi:hypothetical protein
MRLSVVSLAVLFVAALVAYFVQSRSVAASVLVLDRPSVSFGEFLSLRSSPFLIRNGLDGWDARLSWSDSYLKQHAANAVFSVEVSQSSRFGDLAEGWHFKNMTLGEYIDDYKHSKVHLYLNGLIPKSLHSDIVMPPFVPCLNQARPPYARLINMWFGRGGEVKNMVCLFCFSKT